MNNEAITIIFAIIATALGLWFEYTRGRSILKDWADTRGYQILHSERRFWRKGPFWWRTWSGQVIYYVTVRDEQGRQHSGWVRCGGCFLGMLSHKADVIWKD